MSGFLTCAQVAEELGCSARTILRWIEAGEIEAIRLPGGRLRVSQTALAAHLAEWATTSTTAAYTGPSDASGPATRKRPGPGTEGQLHA
jgi:excisionase family DNA binding protein